MIKQSEQSPSVYGAALSSKVYIKELHFKCDDYLRRLLDDILAMC